ncbi:MAG TPA: SH3 domain-containing protein [Thiolinea sp.]|nr:SH3 domain-containing protein [Thiolinea sp.]
MTGFHKPVIACLLAGLSLVATGAFAYDLLYTGTYRVELADPDDTLNCRQGPGLDHAILLRLPPGTELEATAVIGEQKPWFNTDLGCYVRASSHYLIWYGRGEDPSGLCDWRTEPC